MTQLSEALWDESDPSYAPGIMYRANGYPMWRCPKRYVEAGYPTKTYALVRGTKEDGLHPERARICRELMREVVRWWEGSRSTAPEPQTVKWLIGRYKGDKFSPYNDSIKANTRKQYDWLLTYWENYIGAARITSLTFEELKTIEAAMRSKGRSAHFIRERFTMLRSIVKYGKQIKAQGAADLSETLHGMRFSLPPKRSVAATRAQVMAIVEAADADGRQSFSAGVLLQFEFALRAVDVRGQWLKTDEREGGIIRNGRRWQDGLTWDMFDAEVTSFTKTISKTAKSLPEPIHFSFEHLPELRQRILDLAPPDKRVGPVILSTKGGKGLPYTPDGWAQAWARYRKAAGVPQEVQAMDMRAGAISEADRLGANRETLSLAAQHQNIQTTGRYVRGRDEAVAKVVELRRGK